MRCSALLFLLPLGCASSVDYVTGQTTLNRYSVQQDIELGEKLATLVLASTEALGQVTDPDDVYTRAVWRVVARILAVEENRARMPPLPWEVHSVGSPGANAWCFPGGQVVVFAGLLRGGMVQDDDELAAVLGHELAHAAARHGTERMTIEDLRRMIAPFGIFFGTRLVELANPSSPNEAISALGAQANEFGQSQELEADLIGLELVARAGFDPAKASAIWSRLARQGREPSPLEGHPANAARMREIERHLPAARYVASRSSAPPPAGGVAWRWSESDLHATTTSRSLDARGVLPQGAKVRSIRVRARPEILRLMLRMRSGADGEAPRAEVVLFASRDLYEDRLPFSARLWIEPADRPGPPVVFRELAKSAPIEGPRTSMRIALPPLQNGTYRIAARAEVGSLLAAAGHRFDVTEKRQSPISPAPGDPVL